MGYNTDFHGKFTVTPALTPEDRAALHAFATARHEEDEGFPSYWCQWVPNQAGDALVWDGNENFYNYVEWIKYLIEQKLKPKGYTVNGEVEWVGEDRDDRGKILVVDNVVSEKKGRVVYDGEGK